MKITRKINGEMVEIELAESEVLDAFYEMQNKFDGQDMEDYITESSDAECLDIYGVDQNTMLDNVEEIGRILRNYINNYDMSFEFARDEALRNWCAEKMLDGNK
jgi:glutamate/tyrosine decarboxylase-like PLP-dependent enzyme